MIERMIVATAWALVITLVNGAVIAVAAALALSMLRDSAAAIRCRVAGGALFATALLFLATWLGLVLTDTTTAATSAGVLATLVGASLPGEGAGAMPAWVVALTWTITATWLAVAVVRLFRLAESARTTARLARSCFAIPASPLRRQCAEVARDAGVSGVRFCLSPVAEVPGVVGVRTPTIVMPVGIERTLSAAELKVILAHELAHVTRRDYAVNIAQGLLESFFFYHPGVIWLSARLRVEREFACDEAALASGSPITLARALERLESLRAALAVLRVAAPLSLAATSGSLLHRVLRLLSPRRAPSRRARIVAILSTPACATLLAAMTFAALPPDLVGATLRAAAPAARFVQQIDAHDDAGEFTLSIVGLRAVAATLAGQPVPPERIVQRRDSVHLLASGGTSLLSVQLRSTGGFTWNSRPPGAGGMR